MSKTLTICTLGLDKTQLEVNDNFELSSPVNGWFHIQGEDTQIFVAEHTVRYIAVADEALVDA